MKEYRFNPEAYGFVKKEEIAELVGVFGSTTFVKIVAGDRKEAFWYIAIRPLDIGEDGVQIHDYRYQIYSGSYSYKAVWEDEKEHYTTTASSMKTIYLGLISTPAFAEELLKHLLGTLHNESVETDGKKRLFMKSIGDTTEYGEYKKLKGVRLLTEEEKVKVAAELSLLSTENLLTKLESFQELPTCFYLVKKELEKRERAIVKHSDTE